MQPPLLVPWRLSACLLMWFLHVPLPFTPAQASKECLVALQDVTTAVVSEAVS